LERRRQERVEQHDKSDEKTRWAKSGKKLGAIKGKVLERWKGKGFVASIASDPDRQGGVRVALAKKKRRRRGAERHGLGFL